MCRQGGNQQSPFKTLPCVPLSLPGPANIFIFFYQTLSFTSPYEWPSFPLKSQTPTYSIFFCLLIELQPKYYTSLKNLALCTLWDTTWEAVLDFQIKSNKQFGNVARLPTTIWRFSIMVLKCFWPPFLQGIFDNWRHFCLSQLGWGEEGIGI